MELPPPSQQPFDFKAGALLLVNKPLDWTSFDVVNKLRFSIRRLYGQKKFKVGHAGTLDPRATGLLIICTGKWTKQLESLQGLPKTYTGTIELGATTPSYDAETEVDERFPTDQLTEAAIHAAVQQLSGPIQQVPPVFSAIKVDGQRLYQKARKGQAVEIKSRLVTIHRFEATEIRIPEVDFAVDCSKGTYIRSLAYDLGRQLNNGGYLTALRRTAIGPYLIEDAWEVADLVAHVESLDRIEAE